MDEKQIKKTWRQLLIPFFIGFIAFTVGILFHRYGSKRPRPQTIWFFVAVFGVIFSTLSGIKLLKFRKFLKNDE